VRADVHLGELTGLFDRYDIAFMISTRIKGNDLSLNSDPSWSRGSGVPLS
jgi:hypothetical protein